MTDVDSISGVGPAYAEKLVDAGYDTAEAVADADPDDIDELLPTADGEDVVSNAKDATEMKESEPEQEEMADDEPVEDEEVVDDDDELIVFSPGFDDDQEHHLIKALVDREIMARRTNQPARLEMIREAIVDVRAGEPYRLTLEQLSEAYTGINQHEASLRSERGIAGFVSRIRKIKDELQSKRQENWPEN